jgi:hypothetical protein
MALGSDGQRPVLMDMPFCGRPRKPRELHPSQGHGMGFALLMCAGPLILLMTLFIFENLLGRYADGTRPSDLHNTAEKCPRHSGT